VDDLPERDVVALGHGGPVEVLVLRAHDHGHAEGLGQRHGLVQVGEERAAAVVAVDRGGRRVVGIS